MPEHRTRALVLRTFDHAESDRLVHLYTETLGRVSVIAKGARRSRRRFPGMLEILTLIDARLVERPRSTLARLEGATLLRPFEPLVSSLGRYTIACQLLELLDRFTGEREASPELFQFAVGVLEVVEHEEPDRLLGLLVLVKTLARLGYRPGLTACTACGGQIPSRGRVGFASRHGGGVCRRCVSPEDASVPVRVLYALEAGIRAPLRERGQLGLRPSDVALAEILIDRFAHFHLGSQLRSPRISRRFLSEGPLDGSEPDVDTRPQPGGGQPRGTGPTLERGVLSRRP